MNIDLSSFRSMVGEYNLGNVVANTDKSGNITSLSKVNNHATLIGRIFSSSKPTDVQANMRTRQAFFTSLANDAHMRYGNSEEVEAFLSNMKQYILTGKTNGVTNSTLALDRGGTLSEVLDAYDATRSSWIVKKELGERVVVVKDDPNLTEFQQELKGHAGDLLKSIAGGTADKVTKGLVSDIASFCKISTRKAETLLKTRQSTLLAYVEEHLSLPDSPKSANDFEGMKLNRNQVAEAELSLALNRILSEVTEKFDPSAEVLEGEQPANDEVNFIQVEREQRENVEEAKGNKVEDNPPLNNDIKAENDKAVEDKSKVEAAGPVKELAKEDPVADLEHRIDSFSKNWMKTLGTRNNNMLQNCSPVMRTYMNEFFAKLTAEKHELATQLETAVNAKLDEVKDLLKSGKVDEAKTVFERLSNTRYGSICQLSGNGLVNGKWASEFRSAFNQYLEQKLSADDYNMLLLSQDDAVVGVTGAEYQIDGINQLIKDQLGVDGAELSNKGRMAAMALNRMMARTAMYTNQGIELSSLSEELKNGLVNALKSGVLDDISDMEAAFLMETLTRCEGDNESSRNFKIVDCTKLLKSLEESGLKLKDLFSEEDLKYEMKDPKDKIGKNHPCVTAYDKLKSLYLQNGGFKGMSEFLIRAYGKEFAQITVDEINAKVDAAGKNPIDPLKRLGPKEAKAYDFLSGGLAVEKFLALDKKGGSGRKQQLLDLCSTLKTLRPQGGESTATVTLNGSEVTLASDEKGKLTLSIKGADGQIDIGLPYSAARLGARFSSEIIALSQHFNAAELNDHLAAATDNSPRAREQFVRIITNQYGVEPTVLSSVPVSVLGSIAHAVVEGNGPDGVDGLLAMVQVHQESGATKTMSSGAAEIIEHFEKASTADKLKVSIAPPKANEKETPKQAEMREVHELFAEVIANQDLMVRDRSVSLPPGRRIAQVLARHPNTMVKLVKNPDLLDNLSITKLLGEGEDGEAIFSSFVDLLRNVGESETTFPLIGKVKIKDMNDTALSAMMISVMSGAANMVEQSDEQLDAIVNDENSSPIKSSSAEVAKMLKGLEARIDEAAQGMLDMVQDKLTDAVKELYNKLRANSDKDLKIWEKSLSELSQGAVMDPDHGFGPFLEEVLKTYFARMDALDRRTTLAATIRYSANAESIGQILGAMFKGAGPLFQKLLQGLPADQFADEDMKTALKDLKSHLAPIYDDYVKAQMLQLVERSDGAISTIRVDKSLGAASVGQAFLCTVTTPDDPKGHQIVVKILRPDAENRILREQQIFIDAAQKAGMSATYAETLKTIKGEFDFTEEYKNVLDGTVYDQTYSSVVRSMKVSPLADPSMGVIVLEKAPGENVSDYVDNVHGKIETIRKGMNTDDGLVAKNPAEYIATRMELKNIYSDLRRHQMFLQKLVSTWTNEAFFGSGFYHGDLHAGNIMVDDSAATIIDFGNVSRMSQAERQCFMLLVADASSKDADSFLSNFDQLLDPDSRTRLNDPATNAEVKAELKQILNSGSSDDVCPRIFSAIAAMQAHKIEIPSALYKFIQCMIRLMGTVESLTAEMEEVKSTLDSMELAPNVGIPGLDLSCLQQPLSNPASTANDFENAVNDMFTNFSETMLSKADSLKGADAETIKRELLQPTRDLIASIKNPKLRDKLQQSIKMCENALAAYDQALATDSSAQEIDDSVALIAGQYFTLSRDVVRKLWDMDFRVNTADSDAFGEPFSFMEGVGDVVDDKRTQCASQMGWFKSISFYIDDKWHAKSEAEKRGRYDKSLELRRAMVLEGKISGVNAQILHSGLDRYFVRPHGFDGTIVTSNWAASAQNAQTAIDVLSRNLQRLRKAAGPDCPKLEEDPAALQLVLTHFKALCPELANAFTSLTSEAYGNLERAALVAKDPATLAALRELAGLAMAA